jgi:N12 class adenine-specific DNA methylase
MKKKIETIEDTIQGSSKDKKSINKIDTEFSREDLKILKDKINEIIDYVS